MDPLEIDPTRVRGLRRYRWWIVAGAVVGAVVAAVVALTRGSSAPRSPLPLRAAGEMALPGDGSRFDYASLDPERGLLFIAHLGASEGPSSMRSASQGKDAGARGPCPLPFDSPPGAATSGAGGGSGGAPDTLGVV